MRRFPPAGLLVAFWALLYLPPLLAGRTLPARDIGATQIPWRTIWAAQVRAGHLPIWDASSNQGRPMWANPNAMAAYPGTLLFLLGGPERAMGWHLALHHLVLLLGCYVLARRAGAAPSPALVAAAAVGTGGVAFSLLTFANAQAAFAWAPWTLATALAPPEAGKARLRRACLAGALIGLAFLAGEPVTAALTALVWAVVVASTWRPFPLAAVGVAAGSAALAAAPVLVPLLTVYPDTVRGALAPVPAAIGADALAPRRWAELLLPNLLGPPLADAAGGFWAQASFPWQRYYPLVFVPALALACLPFARGRGRRLGVWWAVLIGGVAGAALAASPRFVAGLSGVPMVGAARYGIKLLLPASLALVPLVAAGWEGLAAAWWGAGRRAARWLTGVALAMAALVAVPRLALRPCLALAYPASRASLAAVPESGLRTWALGDLAAQAAPVAAALVTAASPPAAAAALLVADAFASRGVLAFDDATRWAAPPPLVGLVPGHAVLASEAPRGRPAAGPGAAALAAAWSYRAALVPNFGSRWGLGYTLARGPDGLEPVRASVLAAAVAARPPDERARAARALGAAALLVPLADAPAGAAEADGVAAWDLRPTAPDAYLAGREIPADGPVAAASALAAEAFRPGVDAVVDGRGGARELGGGTVREGPGRPDHRRFEVMSRGPGLLVVQQSFVSAWRAVVDGAPAAVVPANGACFGVRVADGRHAVEVFIDRRPYLAGLCGPPLLLALALLLRQRERRWRRPIGAAPS